MSTVTWQQNRRRRPLAAGPGEVLQSFLDQNMKVSDLIDELDDCEWSKDDLAWLVANKKGKVLAWAKKQLANLESAA